MTVTIAVAGAENYLKSLPDNSVHAVVTSPPYWNLRDYHSEGQLGLEEHPDDYVANLVDIFREVRRVLRDDGTCWVNIGDSYSNRSLRGGLKVKDLIGVPWRFAMAAQADGWYLRRDIIWWKSNPVPENVHDRPSVRHEYVFMFSKNSHGYFYDQAATRTPSDHRGESWLERKAKGAPMRSGQGGYHQPGMGNFAPSQGGANLGSVWKVSTNSRRFKAGAGKHPAPYPPELIEPILKMAVSGGGCCSVCATPFDRVAGHPVMDSAMERFFRGETSPWQPRCDCQNAHAVPSLVLDPFFGGGTTGLVAATMGHDCLGIEISSEYAETAAERLRSENINVEVKLP